MITHIVCWKYQPETTAEQKVEHIARLRALPAQIPAIRSFSVGADIVRLERSFDSGIVATFADLEALNEYTDHPLHQEVAALGQEIAEHAVSVDFES